MKDHFANMVASIHIQRYKFAHIFSKKNIILKPHKFCSFPLLRNIYQKNRYKTHDRKKKKLNTDFLFYLSIMVISKKKKSRFFPLPSSIEQ